MWNTRNSPKASYTDRTHIRNHHWIIDVRNWQMFESWLLACYFTLTVCYLTLIKFHVSLPIKMDLFDSLFNLQKWTLIRLDLTSLITTTVKWKRNGYSANCRLYGDERNWLQLKCDFYVSWTSISSVSRYLVEEESRYSESSSCHCNNIEIVIIRIPTVETLQDLCDGLWHSSHYNFMISCYFPITSCLIKFYYLHQIACARRAQHNEIF